MWSFVQESHGNNYGGGGATTIATGAASHTTGNCLFVTTRGATSGTRVLSITDTAGNTYVQRAWSQRSGSAHELWMAQGITGHGSNVVTVNFNGSIAYRGVVCGEFVGTSVVLTDQIASVTGERTTPTGLTVVTPAMTTLIADELIICTAQIDALGTIWTPDTGFSTVYSDGTITMTYRVVSAIQTGLTITMTQNTNNARDILAATFVENGGASPGGGGGESGFASVGG